MGAMGRIVDMFETCLVTTRVRFCEFHVSGSPERDSSSLGVMARGPGKFLGLFAFRYARFLDSSDVRYYIKIGCICSRFLCRFHTSL